MSTESESYLSFGIGVLLGMGVGAAIGILIAPKSGEDMRSDLRDMAKNMPGNVNLNMDDTKDKAMNFIDKTRFGFEKQIKEIDDAIKAGKMAAAKKREELEEEDLMGY
jgi:gas vesicle protein